ncbi:MAG: nitrite reductase [Desulfobulbaceae bacterium]|uniref:Nitrite reductase n=1 Tax=Candidatus Desulfobia pelagia TaxID=2841692 RepID=A0A8J6NDK8_9BACT|nr:nitrite reductase [Candidatus Desulfobia pelagia]
MDITVLLPAGRLPLDIMAKAHAVAEKHGLAIYLSTAQNLRLLDVPEDRIDEVKEELAAVGADFKGPGKFPLPRVCIGERHCKLGLIDTEKLSDRILERFEGRPKTKPKFKIAVSGCVLCCSGVKTTDIGIHASKVGFDVYVGGKGGPYPKVGRRILHGVDEKSAIDAVEKIVEFHHDKTTQKQRMRKLIDHPEFPYPDEV